MATKSTRSSGTQHNQRGVTQGNTLVDPVSGLPISVVEDGSGKKRLCVDGSFSANIANVEVDTDYHDDSMQIGDPNTDATLKINTNGSIDANIEVSASDGDNIAISDGTDQLAINPDGSINVNLTQSNPGVLKTFYNEITSVAASVLSTVQTYTAPLATSSYLQKVEFSGSNIAEFTIEINSVVKDKKRTYFGSSLNSEFKFVETGTGLPLAIGDIVTIKVIHVRPFVGNFNSRMQVIEV
jgi:hypothetical protein